MKDLFKKLIVLILIGFWMIFKIVAVTVAEVFNQIFKGFQECFKMELKEIGNLLSKWAEPEEIKPVGKIRISKPLGVPAKPKKIQPDQKEKGNQKRNRKKPTAKKATGKKSGTRKAPQKSKAKKSQCKK